MSEVKYSYAYFDVINFSNEFATSGYALSICPFTFKPRFNDSTFSNKRVLWDFGDGTTSKSVTASHYYNLPGEYTVSLYIYDGQNEAYFDAFTQTVTIYNFVNDSIVLSAADLSFETSSYRNLFEIYRFNSWQTWNTLSASGSYNIALAVSGNNAPFINQSDYNASKYGHLNKYSQFFEYSYSENIGAYDYIPTDSIKTSSTSLYARVSSGSIIYCDVEDTGSIFVGTSGHAFAVYKDDLPTTSSPTLIFAHFDNINFPTPTASIDSFNYLKPIAQTNSQSFYCTISAVSAANLSITSTGLSAMQINAVQFVNTVIPFVVQIVSDQNFPCKYYNNLKRVSNAGSLSANTIQISFVDNTTNATLTGAVVDDFGTFADGSYGIYKGYCSFSYALSAVKISAVASVSSSTFGTQTLSAESAVFAVVDNDYNISKIGERFDQADTFKQYRFQETLIDKATFFDDFLGTIVGDISASPNTLGKRIHEKTANFVGNTQDVNTCNISSLYSIKQMLDISVKQFDTFNFSVPANLSRLMDILSIKQSRLWGHVNEFAENFDKKGLDYSITWGTNLGSQLDSLTTILTAGSASQPIVAYEKFSDTYRLINTDALSSSHIQFRSNTSTYELSTYNDFWGWGLILPEDFTATDFDKYYIFYEYVPGTTTDVLDSVIDWKDPLNTLTISNSSHGNWANSNGLIQTFLSNALFTGLNLFGAISGIEAPIYNDSATLLALDDSLSYLLLDDSSTELALE